MSKPAYILGISAFYHDSAAALICDGEVVAAAQEERFSRKKHDAGFPVQAIQYCLESAQLNIDDLDSVVFYDKPFLKFERLIETYYAFAPKGLVSFLKWIPDWLKEKLLLRKLIRDELKAIGPYNKKKLRLLFSEHHLSHGASAFFASPFQRAAILTIDGAGEWATASIAEGRGNQIRILRELHFPHSLGLLYSSFTYYLGFRVNSGEYKLMGLAPYGDLDAEQTRNFVSLILNKLCRIYDDGSLWLDLSYFRFATGSRMTHDARWQELLGLPRRMADAPITQIHCNLALAIQQVTEKVVLSMAAEAKRITGAEHIVLAGGVALNCVANAKLRDAKLFSDIFIQPAAGDAGGAIGAAWTAHYLFHKSERRPALPDAMKGAYLGPQFGEEATRAMIQKWGADAQHYSDEAGLVSACARLLHEGKTMGWMQGRMEWGPRALGNRSILADPRNAEMQKKLNLQVKFRESFRPFAPSVCEEDAQRFFENPQPSPYMLFTSRLKQEYRLPLPENFAAMDLKAKLYTQRSLLPAITHMDYSARVQTVNAAQNPRFHALLKAFEKLSGFPMLVNTSFNVRGEPIVCSPEDAYLCFMRTGLDVLVIGNFLFEKQRQAPIPGLKTAEEAFGLD